MDRRPTQRRIVGFRLRNIGWVVVACWLFTLLVCAANDSIPPQSQSHHTEIVAHAHADSHFEHDDLAQHEDACCTVLENLSVPSQVSGMPPPIYSLVYVLLPFIIVLQAVLLAGVRIRFAGTGPPGRPSHTLIANSLWPHAPPR